ncbi:UNKNOWN [Stylonychia lemnae]|uniref:Morn repeat protein n=1 Tax=Stylonychia lemnae TaxID=5949 RepID=A0A077ZSJ3_STYLE|nr:UNKNOWN [Stylonychia lemnae]|eukprot:CDW72832.1 UNKNOWN [Stylonychia lemnae]
MGQACSNCQTNQDEVFNTNCMGAKEWCGVTRNVYSEYSESRNDDLSVQISIRDIQRQNEPPPDSFYSDQIKKPPGIFSIDNPNYYQEKDDDSFVVKSRGKSGNQRVSHKLSSSSRNNSIGNTQLKSKNKLSKVNSTNQTFQYNNINTNTMTKPGDSTKKLTSRDLNPQYDSKNMVYVEEITLIDQSLYTGYMKKAPNGYEVVKHGKGKQVWKDGAKYEGEWRDGKANGKGTFFHVNGDIYEGEFKDDRANGYGTYYHKNGSKYIGSWKDDLKDGFGREEWEDGSYYEGHFKSGCKHGQGTYKWGDKSLYEGVWVNNNIEGHGKYVWPDGRIYEGTWKENKLHGKGVYQWPDGRIYDGFYLDDKKHGQGVYKWPDGRIYDGNWTNGKQHGEGKFTNSKGKCKSGIWENGARIKWNTTKDKSQKVQDVNTTSSIFITPARQQETPNRYLMSTDNESFTKPSFVSQSIAQ